MEERHTGEQDSGQAVLSTLFSVRLARGVLSRLKQMRRARDGYQAGQIKEKTLFLSLNQAKANHTLSMKSFFFVCVWR